MLFICVFLKITGKNLEKKEYAKKKKLVGKAFFMNFSRSNSHKLQCLGYNNSIHLLDVI